MLAGASLIDGSPHGCSSKNESQREQIRATHIFHQHSKLSICLKLQIFSHFSKRTKSGEWTHRPIGEVAAGLQLRMLGVAVDHHPLEVKL